MPAARGTTDLYLGLSMLHYERGDLEAAKQHLLRSEELGKQAAFPFWQYRWCLALARIKETQGDLDGALDLLHEAERLYFRNLLPDIRSISALKTRVRIRQGRLTEAFAWARERGLSVDDELSYLFCQDALSIFRNPYEMVFEIVYRMFASSQSAHALNVSPLLASGNSYPADREPAFLPPASWGVSSGSQNEILNVTIGLAIIGCVVLGIAGFVAAITAFLEGEYVAAGVCLAAAGLSFGLLANAVLRK